MSFIDGAATEWIDQWNPSGAPNQTDAAIRLEPLSIGNAPPSGLFPMADSQQSWRLRQL
jgi:hypothetical protein